MTAFRRLRVRTITRRAGLSTLLVALAAMALGAAPVLAGETSGETGTYGVHILLDNTEYAGTICQSQAGTDLIDKITIRRPIIFGTKGAGTQTVGVQYQIWSNAASGDDVYTVIDESAIQTSAATAKRNAMFPRWSHAVDPVSGVRYEVVVEAFWYASGVTNPVGTASQIDGYYEHVLEGSGEVGVQLITPDYCESFESGRPAAVQTAPAPSAASFPGHSGHYGAHDLIDVAEYPEARCIYSTTSEDTLRTLTIRAPIVYASSRVSGTHAQTVGWRYRIQYNDGDVNSSADWHDLSTSTIVKASATGGYNAQWSGRTYTFADPGTHESYRVAIDMFWYWPSSSHQDGKAVHVGQLYDVFFGSDEGTTDDFCGGTAG